ncbi:MAG: DNA-processing protein DprA [Gammaproteobacteria bacterium]|nr:DNA-processing protein DprA [Gammaproteobacteria bacterium]MBT8063534.1 DNA-processing protein DprA [Gammaproteobacteria bacterium]NNK31983.1 DNA-protecting protein DprA [Xanthomonadales bacterium]
MGGVVRAGAGALRKAGLADDAIAALKSPDASLLESDLAWLGQQGHHLLTWDSPSYPSLLRSIPSAPAALFAVGDPEVLWTPQVAVIGSRNPTAGGQDNARDFAGELSRQGMTVTSGLATGIDSTAHAAALDAGGTTVAVLGTGPDVVYPAGGEALAERIRRRGVLVSELPPGTGAKREHFPSRNRIISGLSLGVLVIEAGLRSGTLITARMAANQGRDVFALPGSIHNPMSKGCHRLIRDGAKLVENVSEVLQELAPLAGRLAEELGGRIADDESDVGDEPLDKAAADPQVEDDPEYRQLLSCIGYDPKPIETIIEQSGLTARAVSAMLLMLELRGTVEAHPGGAYSRKPRGQ